eukprot:Selendium_serpulae@DN6425_c1_g1_i9.p1
MRQATRRPALGCALLLTLLFVALSRLALRAAAEQSVRRQSVESVESVELHASDGTKYGCVGYCPCTPHDEHCPTTDVPVCGSDGETYTNICFAEAQKKDCAPSLTHVPGPCPADTDCTPTDTTRCPLVLAPVCGSDQVTYTNSCFAAAQKRDCNNDLDYVEGHCSETTDMPTTDMPTTDMPTTD